MQDLSSTAKVIIVGSSSCGKTSLVKRLIDNEYNVNEKATLGVNFKIRTFYTTGSQKPIKIHIWDTAGQERFAQLVASYFRGAHVILFTFDLSRRETFAEVETRWFKQAKWERCNETGVYPQNTLAYLIGNKMDTLQRQVKTEDAAQFAHAHEMRGYLEMSAATGEGVMEHFQTIVNDVYDLLKGTGELSDDGNNDAFEMPKHTKELQPTRDLTRRRGNCC